MSGARTAHEVRLYHRLQLAAHLVKKVADREMLEKTGLSVAQVAVLNAIAAGDGPTQRSVGAALGINESAVTAMARRLVESGLVTRARRDGRAHALHLTSEGAAVVREAQHAFRSVNARFGVLPPADSHELAGLLDAIIAGFA
jgi:DNA-binding MarR family transcriptional regulator